MTIKQKTINGLLWSSVDNFVNQIVGFIVGIILARLLSPKEFGLIGMTTVFIAISSVLINSGFMQALIRKQDCSNKDYSTVFFFNLFVSLILYLVIFLASPLISVFFNEVELTYIIRVVSLGLIIESITIIQSTILNKRVDFKLQAKISLISITISGVFGILLAYGGFGVWSLVYRNLLSQIIRSFLLWIWNKWRPTLEFSKTSFKELFSFGSKLMINGVIDTIYNNVYYLIIGKYFSAKELGYYTRADMFKNLPAQNMLGIIFRVSYPVLTQVQDDLVLLKQYYKKMITSTMLISFVVMMCMAALSEPMIITLLGEQWRGAVLYLQILCFVGMLIPLQQLNSNLMLVLGHSDMFLKLEIVKKLFAIPIIIAGIFYGIEIMIIGMLLSSIIGYFLYSYWTGKYIDYKTSEQLIDILPSFVMATSVGIIIHIMNHFMNLNDLVSLVVLTLTSFVLFILISELFRINAYSNIKNEFYRQFLIHFRNKGQLKKHK